MPWTTLAQLKGDQGPQGIQGVQGLPGVNAVANDTATAGYVTAASSATKTALDARFANKAIVALQTKAVYNLDMAPGVDPIGATECSTAVQAAVDYASANNLTLISRAGAHYIINTGIKLRDQADLSLAVFDFIGTTGPAVIVGNAPASIVRKDIKTPYVIALAKTAVGWGQVTGTVGVDIVNVYDCNITVGTIRNFEIGLQIRGQGAGGGATYSKFFLGAIVNNKVNLKITTDGGSGYANQNQTFGGAFNYENAEGVHVAGTRHVLLDTVQEVPDGWTFHELSLEDSGAVCEFHIESYGHNNIFDNCRFETFGGVPSVRWGTGSRDNEIRQGVNVDAIVESVATGSKNRIVRLPGTKVLTASKNIDNTDEGKTLIANGTTPLNFTLQAAAQRSPGTKVTIKNVAASTVTVNTTTDRIDGDFTVTLAQWQSKTFMAQHSPDLRWVTVS